MSEKEDPLVRAFVLLGGLLVLALCTALFAPLFIDWSAYRADFEREAGRILGREVRVEGEASARLLPFPSVTFENVTVSGSTERGGVPFLTIDEFRMNAELAPYLSGEIRIFAMALDNPVLHLNASDVAMPRPSIPTSAEVVLEDVDISNGEIVFADGSGLSDAGITRLTGLDGNFAAESLSGPFAGQGSFDLDGDAVTFDLGIGRSDPDEGTSLQVTFASERYAAELNLDGRIENTDGASAFEGQLAYVQPVAPLKAADVETESVFATLTDSGSSSDDDMSGLRGAVSDGSATGSAPPVRASGTISITGDSVRSEMLRVEVGDRRSPYVLTGGGRIALENDQPSFRLVLEGETFDINALGREEAADTAASDGMASLADRLEAVRAVLVDVPKPPIEGVIELALPVVTFGDTTIRSLAFQARPLAQGWRIGALSAELPGRTLVEADGNLRLEPSFGYAGDLLVASRQPSGFADWLTGTIDPKIRRLSRAGLSAYVDLTAERQTFRDLELDLGGETLTGLIERVPNVSGGRLTARLQGGEVDLDALRALGIMATGSENVFTGVTRYDVALDAGPVRYRDIEAQSVTADILYDGAVLAIAQLDVEGLAGASFTATGELIELGTDPEGKIDLTLASDAPDRFLAFVDELLPDIPVVTALRSRAELLSPLTLTGEVESIERGNGSPTLLLRLDGSAAETEIDFSAAIENGFRAIETSGRVGLELRLESATPAGLLAQIGLPAKDSPIEGPLEIETSISASARGPAVVSASLHTPSTDGNLEGVLDLTDTGIQNIDSSVRLSSQALGPWIAAFGADVGLSEQALADLDADLSASIGLQGATWTVSDLSGALGSTAVDGDLTFTASGGIEGRVRTDQLSVPWLAQLVYGVDPLGEGDELWSSQPFASALLPDRAVTLDVRTDRLDAAEFSASDVTMKFESSAREMTLSDLSGTLLDGDIAGSITMRNLDGLGSISADLRVDELGLNTIASAIAGADDNSDLTLTAKLDATAQSAKGLVSSLSGAGELTAIDLSIPDIPSDPMAQLLVAADVEAFTAADDTSEAFDAIADGAAFPIPRIVSGYTVTAGDVILPPVTVSAEGADLTVSGRLDLTTLNLDTDLKLDIDPGDEIVEGAQSEVRYEATGPVASPTLSRNDAVLANYLAVRALEREQARVEAMQERLEETLRLRREARFYRWLSRRNGIAQPSNTDGDSQAGASEARTLSDAPTPADRPSVTFQSDAAASADLPSRESAVEAGETRSNTRSSSEPLLNFDAEPGDTGGTAQDGFSSLPGVVDPLAF